MRLVASCCVPAPRWSWGRDLADWSVLWCCGVVVLWCCGVAAWRRGGVAAWGDMQVHLGRAALDAGKACKARVDCAAGEL